MNLLRKGMQLKKLKSFSKRLLKNNKGQGMVEYILLLVVIVAIATIFKTPITNAVSEKVNSLKESIGNFSGSGG
jgi:Flp pilus assembly pilin Flp